jgi:hypothetical protein
MRSDTIYGAGITMPHATTISPGIYTVNFGEISD